MKSIDLSSEKKKILNNCIKNELELIEYGFGFSEFIGRALLENSITSFVKVYLDETNNDFKIVPCEYRYFIIEILSKIKEENKEYVIAEVLLPRFGKEEIDKIIEKMNEREK